MARRIRTGMRVRLLTGPAAGIVGTVVDDYCGRTVEWDETTITIVQGTKSHHGENQLEQIHEEEK